MNHFPELTYSIYTDGELSPQEARLVEAHLFLCPQCRQRVEALRAESHMLAAAIKEAGEAPAAESMSLGRSLFWTALSAAGLVAILDGVGSWLGNLVPGVAEWLSPLNRTTLMNLLFTGSLYAADQGTAFLQSIVTTLTVVLLAVGVGGALYFLLRRNSVSLAVLAGFMLMAGTANTASAIEHRKGTSVTIPSGETVEGTLFVTGGTVTVDGKVNGDLIALGSNVVVHGTVNGDVINAGHTFDLEGSVTGNVYTFSQEFDLRGTVEHNVYGWIQVIEEDSNGRVLGDLTAGSSAAALNGEIGRDATLFCGNVRLRGKVGRNVSAYAGNVEVAPSAKVGGDLTAHVHHNDDVHIEAGATIAGKTQVDLEKPGPSRYASRHFYFWEAVFLAGAFLVGLLLKWLFPQAFGTRLDTAASAFSAFGVGFLALVATPIAAIIVAITMIGLPLAIISLFAWLVALYLAKLFVAALIGQGLVTKGGVANKVGPFALAFLAGLFIVTVAGEVPFVGGWIKLLVLLLGLGLLVNRLRWAWKRRAVPVAAAPA